MVGTVDENFDSRRSRAKKGQRARASSRRASSYRSQTAKANGFYTGTSLKKKSVHNTGHRSLSKASQRRGSSGATLNKKHFKNQWERRASAGTTWRDDEIIIEDMKIRPNIIEQLHEGYNPSMDLEVKKLHSLDKAILRMLKEAKVEFVGELVQMKNADMKYKVGLSLRQTSAVLFELKAHNLELGMFVPNWVAPKVVSDKKGGSGMTMVDVVEKQRDAKSSEEFTRAYKDYTKENKGNKDEEEKKQEKKKTKAYDGYTNFDYVQKFFAFTFLLFVTYLFCLRVMTALKDAESIPAPDGLEFILITDPALSPEVYAAIERESVSEGYIFYTPNFASSRFFTDAAGFINMWTYNSESYFLGYNDKNGTWYVGGDKGWEIFEPEDTDIIVYRVDLGNVGFFKITAEENFEIHGVRAGIYAGEITMQKTNVVNDVVVATVQDTRALEISSGTFFVRCGKGCLFDICAPMELLMKGMIYGGMGWQIAPLIFYPISKGLVAQLMIVGFILHGLADLYFLATSFLSVFFIPKNVCVEGWMFEICFFIWIMGMVVAVIALLLLTMLVVSAFLASGQTGGE